MIISLLLAPPTFLKRTTNKQKTHTTWQHPYVSLLCFLSMAEADWINGSLLRTEASLPVTTFMSCPIIDPKPLGRFKIGVPLLPPSYGKVGGLKPSEKIWYRQIGSFPKVSGWKVIFWTPKMGGFGSNDLQSWKASPSFSRKASEMYWRPKRGVQTPVL